MSEPNKKSKISLTAIQELQRSYDDEVDRRKSLDSKASTLLGFVSIIVTTLGFIFKYFLDTTTNLPGMFTYGVFITASMSFLALSLGFIINAFRIRKYNSPFKDNYNDISLYLKKPENKLHKRMIYMYAESVRINKGQNADKANSISMATILLGIAVFVALISPLVVYWGRFWTNTYTISLEIAVFVALILLLVVYWGRFWSKKRSFWRYKK